MFSRSKNKVAAAAINLATNVDIIVGKTANFKGELNGVGVARVDGRLEGTINVEGDLIIGPSGSVVANIKVNNATLSGKVQGNVLAEGKVEILATAVVIGDISAKSIMIEEGAKFNGRSKILDAEGELNLQKE